MDKGKLYWVLQNVPRRLEPTTDDVLSKYAQMVPENGVIVDVGTMGGGSAFIMATSSLPSVKVYTIDPTPHPIFLDFRKKLSYEDKVIQFKKTGEEVVKSWDKPIDLWFEDCWHEYTRQKATIQLWLPHIKKDALMIWHDYDLYGKTNPPNLQTAIDEGEGKYYRKIDKSYNVYIARKI